MNEELIVSAISFLKDPNVLSSPLTKKVEFLESKGLNQQEIEEALKRANSNESTANSTAVTQPPKDQHQQQQNQHQQLQQAPIDYYNPTPPQLPDRSWKDYFIMATATAGVTYGLYQVVSKYLVPTIIPAKQSSIDEDKAKINEEFIKIDKLLETLENDQKEIKTNNEDKSKEIDTAIDNVNDFLSKYNKDKLKFDDDLRLMKLEIDNLKNSIEKNMNSTKENIKDELEEISEELTSLKNLIKARSEDTSNGVRTTNNNKDYRKIPPVSSIPSASEILKRAKANAQSNSGSTSPSPTPTPAPNSNAVPITNTNSNPADQTPNDTREIPSEGGSTVGNVTAAGIPAWQLKHKEEEEKSSSTEQPSNPNTNTGIPAWQQQAQSKEQEQAESLNDDSKVDKEIANAGVPSWQLNSNASS